MEENQKKVGEIIEEVKAEICDHYCKYANYIEKYAYYIDPDEYNEILEIRCAKCPLNRL